MSGSTSPTSSRICFRQVPRTEQVNVPVMAVDKVAKLSRTLADTETYKALSLHTTTDISTRSVKRLVAFAAPNDVYEFKSAYLSGRTSHGEIPFERQLAALVSLLGGDYVPKPFTLYVFSGKPNTTSMLKKLVDQVHAVRPDVKVVIGQGPTYGSRDECTSIETFALRQLPWDLQSEALALMLAKSSFPIRPQDAVFWLGLLGRDAIQGVLAQATLLLRRNGGITHPEDAELALSEAVCAQIGDPRDFDEEPQFDCVVPAAAAAEVPVRARQARAALRAALSDLGTSDDPYMAVALCRIQNLYFNDSVAQLVDACTQLPVYRMTNGAFLALSGETTLRRGLLMLTRALRDMPRASPSVLYLPMGRLNTTTLSALSAALYSVDPAMKLVVGSDMSRADEGVDVEWFDVTSLALEDPIETRNKRLLGDSGLHIAPLRGHQLLKQLSPEAAARAIRQAQVQRRRPAAAGLEDVALLEAAVRTLQSPESVQTEDAEKYLQPAGEPTTVKASVAGIPDAVLQFGQLIKHYAAVKQVVPSAAKTLLLKGPPGTGKTATAKALAAETGFPLFAPKSSEMISKWVGESANAVYKLFEQANTYARQNDTTALIFIDEIDALLKARGGGEGGEREYERVTNALLECIQGTADAQYERVVVIGATNLAHQMDPAALDRFAIKAEIGLPDVLQLEDIFRIHLRNRSHTISETALHAAAELAFKNHFSGRHVVHTLNQAGYAAFSANAERPQITDLDLAKAVADSAASVAEGDAESQHVRATQYLVRDIKPGALSESVVGAPKEVTRFVRAIGAYAQLKSVVPDAQRSLLLKGPPGTGKTSIARGIAAQTGFPLFAPKSSSLISSFVGQSAERLYKFVAQVRAYATAHNTTAIIFFDEIDALVSQRGSGGTENNRMVNAFLETLSGVNTGDEDNVVVIGATNLEQELDAAMLDRFSSRAEVGLPDAAGLEKIFRLHLTRRAHALSDADLKDLGRRAFAQRFSGRNVVHVLDRAGFLALEARSDEEGELKLTAALVRAALEVEVEGRGKTDAPPEHWYV